MFADNKLSWLHLLGNVLLPRNTQPTIRSSQRRLDADGVSATPYYANASGKTLKVTYTQNDLTPATQNIALAGNSLATIISNINAVDAANLFAFDDGGFLAVQNLNPGKTHYIKINTYSPSGSDAGPVLGFIQDPLPGSISYAGEFSSTPGIKSQSNPNGTALIGQNEDFTSSAFNRSLASVLLLLDKAISDLERPIVVFKDVSLTFANHPVSTAKRVAQINDDTIRLPLFDFFDTNGNTVFERYFRILTNNSQIFNTSGTYSEAAIVQAYYATSGTSLTSASVFSAWGTPDGHTIYSPTSPSAVPNKDKQASTAVTSIVGNVVYCAGALFQTKKVAKGDPVQLTASTLQPFDHSGWFAVSEVLDETHLSLRPMSPSETAPAAGNKPQALNPAAGGTLRVAVGYYIPSSSVWIETNDTTLTTATVRIATAVPFREALAEHLVNAHPGSMDAILTLLQAHINNTSGTAHQATGINGFTSATTWADSTTITGATLKATIENILTKLSDSTSTAGTKKIGAAALSIAGVAPNAVSSGTIYSQLIALLTELQSHENDSSRHGGYGVISGYNNTSNSALNFTVGTGSALHPNGEIWTAGSPTVLSLADNNVSSIWVDGTTGTVTSGITFSTPYNSPNIPLFQATTSGGAITKVVDVRRKLTKSPARLVTVGATNCDFTTLEGAILWVERNRQAGETKSVEIVIQGNVTMTTGCSLDYPVIIRGVAVDGASGGGSGSPLSGITTPSGTAAFTLGFAPLGNVVFRDLYVTLNATSGSTFLDLVTGSLSPGDDWVFDNVIFDGGNDATSLVLSPVSTANNWLFNNVWFKNAVRTGDHAYVSLNSSAVGFSFRKCRFIGETTDTNVDGITCAGTDCHIDDCTFTLGGLAVSFTGSSTFNKVTNCKFKSNRRSTISHSSTGENFIDDNIFDTIATNISGSDAPVAVTAGTCHVRRNRIKDPGGSAAAIRFDGGSDHLCESNIISQTGANVGLILTSAPRTTIRNNYLDALSGATTGNGNGSAIAVSADSSAVASIIEGNRIRNAGSTGSISLGVIKVDTKCIVRGNKFHNCRGVLIKVTTDRNIVTGNQVDDIGTTSSDVCIELMGTSSKTLIYGNQFTTTSSALPILIVSGTANNKMFGNLFETSQFILNNTQNDHANDGIGPRKIRVVSAPGSTSWANGDTEVQVIGDTNVQGCHLPLQILLPAETSAGTIQSGIKFTFSDGTSTTQVNATGAPVTNDYTVLGTLTTNGLTIVRVALIVRNTTTTQTFDPGSTTYEEWIIG